MKFACSAAKTFKWYAGVCEKDNGLDGLKWPGAFMGFSPPPWDEDCSLPKKLTRRAWNDANFSAQKLQ